MHITLSELKGYLRIDSDDDDLLLELLLSDAKKRVCEVARVSDTKELEENEALRVAELFAASYLYEHREDADHNRLNLTLRALLFGVRSDAF